MTGPSAMPGSMGAMMGGSPMPRAAVSPAPVSAPVPAAWTHRPPAVILSGGLHGSPSSAFYAGDLIVFTTGLLITALLLALTLRAAKLPGTPLVNIGFAACAFLWCAGGLARSLCSAVGLSSGSHAALVSRAVQYSAAAAFPIAVLALWRPFAVTARQKAGADIELVVLESFDRTMMITLFNTLAAVSRAWRSAS